MKVYVIWADTWNAPYGCQISLFGVFSTKELADKKIEELEKENRVGETLYPLVYYVEEFSMNDGYEIYLDGYVE